MRVLIVKLSSLGDVVHALPVVADIRAAYGDAVVDWVVEPAFAPLVRAVRGIGEVIECPLRRWTKAGWWTAPVRAELRAFVHRLRRDGYDAVIDLQGLSKSAVIARLARGPSVGLANRTEGASHEWPARWLADRAIRVEPHSHALDRSRELVARALGTRIDAAPRFGLEGPSSRDADDARGTNGEVVLVHGTSRADKLWPEANWIRLGQRLVDAGARVALPQSDAAELARAGRIANSIGAGATVWPSIDLGGLVERLRTSAGVIGVDSGPSHIAVALGLPHVQIYNLPTAWRTGPQPGHGHRQQVSVEGTPPSVDAVWTAWLDVATVASIQRAAPIEPAVASERGRG